MTYPIIADGNNKLDLKILAQHILCAAAYPYDIAQEEPKFKI